MSDVAILNPRAGLAAQRARAALAASLRWRDAIVRVTTGPGEARRFAEEAAAAGAAHVLSIGGDGTANEIAWGLLGTTTVLGLVPMGSGNGLARTLGIPLRPAPALAALAEAVPRAMDVGMINGRQYGGGAVLVPGARLDDGLLDVVVIEDAPFYELAFNAIRLFVGGIEGFRRYRHIPATRAVLTAVHPAPHHRDGEPEPPASRLEASVMPRALRILVPRATAEDARGPFGPDR